jgi:hypothetical protein
MSHRRLSILAIAAAAALWSAPSEAQPVDGFGRDIPLSFAVKQIVPSGYDVSYGPGVDEHERVSWKGGREWTAVLKSMASDEGLEVSLDGMSVRIDLAAGAAQPMQASVQAQPGVQSGGFMIVPYKGGQQAAQPAQATAAPGAVQSQPLGGSTQAKPTQLSASAATMPSAPVGSWTIAKGETLRASLDGWTKKAGWTLVWNSQYEYPIQAGAAFGGDFVSATSDLFKSLLDVRPALTVKFYRGNKVLLVTNDSADEVN